MTILLNDVKAAEQLGQSVFTLRNQRGQGRGPKYVRLGRSIRYDLKDLLDYIEQHKVSTNNG